MISIRRLRLIRILLCCAAASGSAVLLAGCWDRVEVNDLAIVTAAGFDAAENNRIKLSVQLFVPTASSTTQSMGESTSTGGGTQVIVKSAVGINTADAASKLQQLLSRRLFWGQADSFIFGESLARRGLKDPYDFLIRHPQPRERADLYISKGDAESVLAWQPAIERNSSEVLREMSNLKTAVNVTLLQSVVQLTDEAHTTLIPLVSMKKVGQEKPTIYINGSAAIKDLKMKHLFNTFEMRGLMWLRNEVETTTLSVRVPEEDGVASLRLLSSHTRLKPAIRNGEWIMRIKMEAEGNIDENSTTVDVSSAEKLEEFETLFENELKRRVAKAIESAQQAGTDVVGFAEQFNHRYPHQWKAHKADWDRLFPTVKTEYDVTVNILRSGLIGRNEVLKLSEEEQ
ncbi:Ger(x)C family spore germination protein [Paenibacillus thailandensis]|uniref:Ger(X)C family spore germination protein n=1 Tax=Paenibacillus thailandensis TaxID=393250 RepID=A0ABW5R0J5_9BACL